MLDLWQALMILQEQPTKDCILLSLRVVAFAMPLLALCGVFIGYVLGRGKGPWRALLDFLVTLPLIFPPIATGFLLLLLLGRRSFIGSWLKLHLNMEIIFSFWGIALAAFIAGLPLVVKQVQPAMRREANALIEKASLLGKGPVTVFFRVTLPSLQRNIAIGLSLAFARILGEVGVTLMLGGNISGRTNTISLEIYNAVFTGEYEKALVLVMILGTISFVVILLCRRLMVS